MSEDRTKSRKVLLEFLTKKLFHLAGLRQVDKMSKQDIADWLNVMESVYKSKRWVDSIYLSIILTRGCMGSYGEFTSLNARVLHTWIDQYYRDNSIAIDKLMKDLEVTVETSNRNKVEFYFKQGRDRFISMINILKENKPITYHNIPDDVDPGNCWFKYMEECGLISTDHQSFEQMRKVAALKLSNVMNRGTEFTVTIPQAGIDSEAKVMLLKNTIAKWVNDGEDIEGIFKDYGVFDTRAKYFFDKKVN